MTREHALQFLENVLVRAFLTRERELWGAVAFYCRVHFLSAACEK
jgi:hypothetical protein